MLNKMFLCSFLFFYFDFFFFFRAEDGIRDTLVTGVQTCALPICCCDHVDPLRTKTYAAPAESAKLSACPPPVPPGSGRGATRRAVLAGRSASRIAPGEGGLMLREIGRASCRERVSVAGGGEALQR